MKLHLEGIILFEDIASEFREKTTLDKISPLKKHVWSRMTLFVQATLILISLVVLQTFRFAASSVSGVLTLDRRKIQSAFVDLLSLGVHIFVLPVLGIVATFSPSSTVKITSKLIKQSEIVTEELANPCETLSTEITGIVRGILGVPIGIVNGVVLTLSGFLMGKFEYIQDGGLEFVFGIISPFLGLGAGLHHKAREKVWEIHWIAIKQKE